MPKTRRFAAELRGNNSWTSDDMDAAGDASVVVDTLHPNVIHEAEAARFYASDDHDAVIEVAVEGARPNDPAFEATVEHAAVSLDTGLDGATVHLSAPLGRVRLAIEAVSEPTEGTLCTSFLFPPEAVIQD